MIKSQNSRSNPESELQEAVQQDLRTHGVSLYQDIVLGFASSYVNSKDHMQSMNKNDEEDFKELFEKTENDFSLLLEQKTTFKRDKMAGLQLNQNLIKVKESS